MKIKLEAFFEDNEGRSSTVEMIFYRANLLPFDQNSIEVIIQFSIVLFK